MSIRLFCADPHRLGAFALWGALSGLAFTGQAAAADPVVRPETDPRITAEVEAPPLPPRNLQAQPFVQRHSASGHETQTFIDVVVTSTPQARPVARVDALGWRSETASTPAPQARTSISTAEAMTTTASGPGRIRVASLPSVTHVEAPPAIPVAPSRTEGMPPAVWTVVESPNSADSPPLVEAGVLQSSAVFDGVPVRVNDLAPVPTSEVDEALLPMIAQFASLAPHPLAAGEAAPLASIDATQETGRKPWFGEAGAGSDLTGEQLDRMDAAVAMLQRPLNQVSLSQGLHKREPPDLALAATPATAPHTVWGEPWPNVRLSRFRYTVPFNHRPLYFEQPNFERCGESWGLFSPYVSAANFAGNVVMLPVHALLDPPWTCVPTLGDCPSCYRYDFCPIFGNRE